MTAREDVEISVLLGCRKSCCGIEDTQAACVWALGGSWLLDTGVTGHKIGKRTPIEIPLSRHS